MEAPNTQDTRAPGCFYRAPLSDEPAVFRFERLEPPNYKLLEQFEYVDRLGHWYRVPAAPVPDEVGPDSYNETDFASVPFFLTWLVPKDGSHTPAAILHDAFIGGQKGLHYETSSDEPVPESHGDYLFREAMEQSGVAWLRRWLMWAAVAVRTLTTSVAKACPEHDAHSRLRWGRVIPIGAVVVLWTLLSAAMALDVPDLIAETAELPWLGNRSWFSEVGWALAMVGVGAIGIALIFGALTQSKRGLGAGALAGVAIGFLGLPMLAALVGAGGYFVLEKIAGVVFPARRRTVA